MFWAKCQYKCLGVCMSTLYSTNDAANTTSEQNKKRMSGNEKNVFFHRNIKLETIRYQIFRN